jgi:hypothetical protein
MPPRLSYGLLLFFGPVINPAFFFFSTALGALPSLYQSFQSVQVAVGICDRDEQSADEIAE